MLNPQGPNFTQPHPRKGVTSLKVTDEGPVSVLFSLTGLFIHDNTSVLTFKYLMNKNLKASF